MITKNSIAQPNNYLFKTYTTANGLGSNVIAHIAQDTTGFYWIATYNGLTKFDGNSFVNYTFNQHDKHSIGSNIIQYVYTDKWNRVFVLTPLTLSIYNRSKDNFDNYPLQNYEGKTFQFWNGFVANYNEFWMGTYDNQLIKFDILQKKMITTNWNKFIFEENKITGMKTNYPVDMMKKNEQEILIIGNQGIYSYNQKSKHFHTDCKTEFGRYHQWYVGVDDGKENIYMGSYDEGIVQYNYIEKKISKYELPENYTLKGTDKNCYNVRKYNDSLLIICTTAGISFFNLNTKKYANLMESKLYNNYNLPVGRFQQFWLGKNNEILANVDKCGLSIGTQTNYFTTIKLQNNEKRLESYSSPIDDGEFYIVASYYQGKLFFLNKNTLQIKKEISTICNTPLVDIHNIEIDKKNNIWCICANALFIKKNNSENWKKLKLPEKNNPTSKQILYDVIEFNNVYYVLNLFQGIFTYNQNFELGNYLNIKYKEDELIPTYSNLLFDSASNSIIYYLDFKGIYQYHFGTKQVELLKINDDNYLLNRCHILDLINDHKGNLYIILNGIGLAKINLKTKNIIFFGKESGLNVDLPRLIFFDKKNKLWVISYSGLSAYNDKNKKFTNIEFPKNISVFVNKPTETYDGKFIFGTENCLIQFNPTTISKENKVKNLYFSLIAVNGKALNIDSNYIFSPNQHTITFQYNIVGAIEDPLNNLYRYRLVGQNNRWVTSMDNKINFSGIISGKYTFEVCLVNDDGSWGNPLQFSFIVANHFYNTLWFYFILALCLACLVYWNYLYFKKQQTKKETLALQQLENKYKFERIANYFSNSMSDKSTLNDVLWDVCKNLIAQLGFVDGMVYLWNEEKTKMVQVAGIGPKGTKDGIKYSTFDVEVGQGIVGLVMQTHKPFIVYNSLEEPRYRADHEFFLSEICVPIIKNNELIGILDSEHPDKNYFNDSHLLIMTTIASLIANKMETIEKQNQIEKQKLDVVTMQQKLTDAELSALRSQMNPHFIFNTLNSINSFVIGNNPHKASNYLTKFAKLMRLILDNSRNKSISLEKELEALKLYLLMEGLRFDNKFEFEIDIDEEVEVNSVQVPPLILQPYFENAIWHGLLHKEEIGVVKLSINKLNENLLEVKITDNGIGRQKSKELKSKTVENKKSYGMQITSNRLNILSNNLNQKNNIQINDLYDDNQQPIGTQVILHIPI